jgi:hypothetical protein|tara:strand:- start:31 stop:738 length:708 start_codon:yes stop_codon:yes gene_type:complete
MLLSQFLNTYSEDNKWFGPDEDSNGYLVMYREPIKRDKVKRIKKFELFNCDYCGQNAIKDSYLPTRIRKDRGKHITAKLCSRHSPCYSKHATLSTIEGLRKIGVKPYSRENPKINDAGYLSWTEYELDESGYRIKSEKLKSSGWGKNKSKEVFLHVVLMEEYIGRKLAPDECVHHIDNDKLNNNIDNLWLCNRRTHSKAHWSMNKLVSAFLKSHLIKFNRKAGEYEMINKAKENK